MKYIFVFLNIFIAAGCTSSSNSKAQVAQPIQFITSYGEQVEASLVTVKSTYKDQTTQRSTVVSGTGFMVSVNEKLFVVTASHVSQGENTKILFKDKEIQFVGRYYPHNSDIEIFEIENSNKYTTNFKMIDNIIFWTQQADVKFRIINASSFVLKNSWIKDDTIESDNLDTLNTNDILKCDIYCFTLFNRSLIQAGYSGSPLVTQFSSFDLSHSQDLPFDIRESLNLGKIKDKFILRGMAIKRDRYFAKSVFIPMHVIGKTINDYISKKLNPDNEYNVWKLNSNLLIRQVGYDTFEASAIGAVVGNGVSMDGGDDLFDDITDSPSKVLAQLTPYPVSADQKERMFWFFISRTNSGELISQSSWFDAESYQYIKRFNLSVSPSDPDNLMYYVRSRFLGVKDEQIVISQNQKASVQFKKDIAQIEISDDPLKIQFSIQKNGTICQTQFHQCGSVFSPILELVASDNMTTYIVDIKHFLFFDVSYISELAFNNSEISKMSEKEFLDLLFGNMKIEMNKKSILYRKKINTNKLKTFSELNYKSVTW